MKFPIMLRNKLQLTVNLTIKDSNDNTVMSIEGQDIIYLNGNYFAVKNKNGKYYICKVLLKEEQVK